MYHFFRIDSYHNFTISFAASAPFVCRPDALAICQVADFARILIFIAPTYLGKHMLTKSLTKTRHDVLFDSDILVISASPECSSSLQAQKNMR